MPRIFVDTRKGSPYPPALEGIITEELLEKIKAEAHTARVLQDVVDKYNAEMNWGGGLLGEEVNNSSMDIIKGKFQCKIFLCI